MGIKVVAKKLDPRSIANLQGGIGNCTICNGALWPFQCQSG